MVTGHPFRAKHGRTVARGPLYVPWSIHYDEGLFGRLFPGLPSFANDTPEVRDALIKIGDTGGPLDANDDLSKTPQELITNPALSVNNPDNPKITAGMTFLGQLIDHDLTFDPTSSLERSQDPEAIRNFRTPALELDNLYGSGPGASPHLYDQQIDFGRTKFLIEDIPNSSGTTSGGQPQRDVPRNSQLMALIGDPRNDENLIVSQLHLAFLKFHNAVVDHVKTNEPSLQAADVFREAQRLVRWHYQWIILNQFLKQLVPDDVLDDVLKHNFKAYKWQKRPFMPVEFAVAAYRFGHSQIRPSYRANFGKNNSSPFFAFIFDDTLLDSADPNDLRGGKRAERRFIHWETFFDFNDGNVRQNKKIDTNLSSVLFNLVGIPPNEPQALAQRNLLRNLVFGVPSGQAVANFLGIDPLTPADFSDLAPFNTAANHKFDRSTPLWFYILREAELAPQKGERLGPVGGRIVAEVFIGLLLADPTSYLSQWPKWRPNKEQFPLPKTGTFDMTDLLTFAGEAATLS
jgi:hypothetical protein